MLKWQSITLHWKIILLKFQLAWIVLTCAAAEVIQLGWYRKWKVSARVLCSHRGTPRAELHSDALAVTNLEYDSKNVKKLENNVAGRNSTLYSLYRNSNQSEYSFTFELQTFFEKKNLRPVFENPFHGKNHILTGISSLFLTNCSIFHQCPIT